MKPRQSRARGLALLVTVLALDACSTRGSSEPTVNACRLLPLATYSQAEQSQVAAEIEAAPASAVWPGWISDYGALRAAVRACRGDRS